MEELSIYIAAALIGGIAAIIGCFISYKWSKIEPLDIKEPLKELSNADSVQKIASSQINILSIYYNNVLRQSHRNLYSALAAAGIGLLFIIAAAGVLLVYNLQSLALIAALGGALSAFVSGVNFYIYNKFSSQLADSHKSLDMTQRFLLSNGLCNSIEDMSTRDATRADLIKTIAGMNSRK